VERRGDHALRLFDQNAGVEGVLQLLREQLRASEAPLLEDSDGCDIGLDSIRHAHDPGSVLA
jgi:aryl carrier-like protein